MLSGAFALTRVQGAALGPIEGVLIDKFGPRRMVMAGFIVMGIGFVLFSLVQTAWHFYIAFVVISLGAGLGGWLAMIAAVTNWFIRHRAMALSIGMSGTHVAGLLVPFLALGIEAFGFEKVALGIGLALLVIAIPAGRLVRNYPEEYGLVPTARPSRRKRRVSPRPAALRTRNLPSP